MKRNKERQRVSLQEPNDNPHGRRPDHSARTRRRAQRTRPRIRRRIPATPVVHTRRRRQSDNKPDRSRKTNRGRSTRHKNNATTSRRQTSPQNVLPTLVPIRPQYASISFFSCVFFLILNCTSLPSLSRTWIWQRQREHTTTRNMQRRQRTRDNHKTSSGCETSLQQKNHMQVHAHSHQRDMDGRSKPSEREREEYSLEMAAPPPHRPQTLLLSSPSPMPALGQVQPERQFQTHFDVHLLRAARPVRGGLVRTGLGVGGAFRARQRLAVGHDGSSGGREGSSNDSDGYGSTWSTRAERRVCGKSRR